MLELYGWQLIYLDFLSQSKCQEDRNLAPTSPPIRHRVSAALVLRDLGDGLAKEGDPLLPHSTVILLRPGEQFARNLQCLIHGGATFHSFKHWCTGKSSDERDLSSYPLDPSRLLPSSSVREVCFLYIPFLVARTC